MYYVTSKGANMAKKSAKRLNLFRRSVSTGSCEVTVDYRRFDLTFTCEYTYYSGTTPAMGDDPSEIVDVKVFNRRGNDITKYLHKSLWKDIIEYCEENALEEGGY